MGFWSAPMVKGIALITGASRGLGFHLAKRFWDDGWSLILVGRDKGKILNSCSFFENRPLQKIEILSCDLSNAHQLNKLVDIIRSSYEYLDVLINNAAIQGPIGPITDSMMSDWSTTIQVNLLSPVTLCKGLIPLLSKRINAAIINLSGGGATGPRPNFSAYASSKVALVRFSETLANELSLTNIRVNCIAPGPLKTQMLEEILLSEELSGSYEFDKAKKVFKEGGASLDSVADLALFLASERSIGINGKLISAVWDRWEAWPNYIKELNQTDAYTLRRVNGKDRGLNWGDK